MLSEVIHGVAPNLEVLLAHFAHEKLVETTRILVDRVVLQKKLLRLRL